MTSAAVPLQPLPAARYPQRASDRAAPAWRTALRRLQAHARRGGASALPSDVACEVDRTRAAMLGAGRAGLAEAAADLRTRLRACDLTAAAGGEALGLAAAAMQSTLGFVPYDTQVRAAWLMLDGALVEMATGEGKTLAAALAAAAAALAGVPVHVLTANDYLVARDRDAMAPLFGALGLRSASVVAPMSREARALAYRSDIVYVTGREIVFDYLKDHMALGGERDPREMRQLSGPGHENPSLFPW